MQDSAETWMELFVPALLQSLGEKDHLSVEQVKLHCEQAGMIADLALEEYQNRWPGV